MQNTQPKFKWHNEVIAWLNGESIEWRYNQSDPWSHLSIKQNQNIPAFNLGYEYRIKPKEVIKYAGIYEHLAGAIMGEQEFETLQGCVKHTAARSKFQKRTYLNGELIALELVKV